MKNYIIKENGYTIGELYLYPEEVINMESAGFVLVAK